MHRSHTNVRWKDSIDSLVDVPERDDSEGAASSDEKAKKEAEELSREQEHVIDIRGNRELREKYAGRAFWYLCSYSIFAGLIILLDGFGVCDFEQDPSVLKVLVGSTAVSAIGLVLSVIHGLFRNLNR